jgi:hypothetical protein
MKPRSNLPGLLMGIVIAVALIAGVALFGDGSYVLLWRSRLIGFAFVPLSIALAELRSGYAWKNLAPGNRGSSRLESPSRFWISVIWHMLFAVGLVTFTLIAAPLD